MSRLRWPDSTNSVSEKPGTIHQTVNWGASWPPRTCNSRLPSGGEPASSTIGCRISCHSTGIRSCGRWVKDSWRLHRTRPRAMTQPPKNCSIWSSRSATTHRWRSCFLSRSQRWWPNLTEEELGGHRERTVSTHRGGGTVSAVNSLKRGRFWTAGGTVCSDRESCPYAPTDCRPARSAASRELWL